MDNVVDILVRMDLRHSDKAGPGAISRDPNPHVEDLSLAEDRFLIDEGLDLLAAYRSIEDESVRQAIRTLVEMLAKAGHGGETTAP